jgi:uncharacterized coiled-coil DUF342 family protein
MTTQSIALAVTALALISTAACQRDEVERKAEDVQDAREQVQEQKQELQEAKTELREEKTELAIEVRKALSDAEERYRTLDVRATTAINNLTASGADVTTGPAAEIHQAHMLAKAKMEAARTATTPEQTHTALTDAKDALDKLEKRLDDYKDAV